MAGIKDYFSFSKRERTGALILIILIVIIYLLPAFFATPKRSLDPKAVEEMKQQMAELKRTDRDTNENFSGEGKENYMSDHEPSYKHQQTILLFQFDPNTLSAGGWKKLGLNDRTIKTISNYISKGGKFRKPEDIKKIYGLRRGQYEQLLPFVLLKSNDLEKKQRDSSYAIISNYRKMATRPHAIIDINSADTSLLIALPGIGTKLANRILHFRDKLGGFYSVEQVREIYGLQDSAFQKIKPFLQCNVSLIQQININTADAEILKDHPYIKWNIANAIISYRLQHGSYLSLEELLKIEIISPEMLEKLTPYLKVL
ncbi:MAG: helix-hairpin-helix domain-containing protein [Chitinophagaceae bacterium]|nr:helix-hairpin-helix domain-containing protein [Chitinophagaceae bacterium]